MPQSSHEFDGNCPDCKRLTYEIAKSQSIRVESPAGRDNIEKIWSESSFEERKAFHNVVCRNSKKSVDIELFRTLNMRLKSEAQVLPASLV